MRICLFEDEHVATLEPIALSRPAFDLRCGMSTLVQKHERFFHPASIGALIRPHLAPLAAKTFANMAVNDAGWLSAGPTILVNSRWLPPAPNLKTTAASLQHDGPSVGVVDGEIAYAVLPGHELGQCTFDNLKECLGKWQKTLPSHPAGGKLLRYLWEVVEANAEQIGVDSLAVWGKVLLGRPTTMALVGPSDRLHVEPSAVIEPFVVADTHKGPVIIDRDAVIASFTRLEGPCYIGPRTQVFGAKIRGGTSIGPNCRIGGEVEASIVQANANKYHEGFLGHSYVGEWVNLAAGTYTSDLRSDYGDVKIMVNGALVNTGQKKVGSYIGDHTKTGLGVLMNTGSNVGIFANLLPTGQLLPRFVPSYCWVEEGKIIDRADLQTLFTTAVRAMDRRGEVFGNIHRELFQSLYEKTAAIRSQAIQKTTGR